VSRVIPIGLALAACLWLLLLVAAAAVLLGVPITAGTYAFGSLICHQQPDRSFHLGLAQLPVCARCTGLYAGAVIGSLVFLRLRLPADPRILLIAAAAPTAVTWLVEIGALAALSNTTRAIAALPLGAAVAAVTLRLDECARPRRTASRRPPILS
jgi:uncharacterized membrane protein